MIFATKVFLHVISFLLKNVAIIVFIQIGLSNFQKLSNADMYYIFLNIDELSKDLRGRVCSNILRVKTIVMC